MSNTDAAIREAVDAFVDQLRSLIQQAAIESVHVALNGGAAVSRRGSKSAPGATQKGRQKGSKRTPAELAKLVTKLRAHVAKHPGQRIEQIGKTLAVPTKELVLPVKKLLSEGRLSTKGAKRATMYFAK